MLHQVVRRSLVCQSETGLRTVYIRRLLACKKSTELMDPTELQSDAGPRKVYLRWLLDSKKFNEWMNPIDYETEEYQAEQEALDQRQAAVGRGRQADALDGAGNSSKRKFSPGGEAGARRAAPRQRTDPGDRSL